MKAKKSKTALRLLAFLLAFAMAFTAMPVMALDAELPEGSVVAEYDVPEYEVSDEDYALEEDYDYEVSDEDYASEEDYDYEVDDDDYGYYDYATEDEPTYEHDVAAYGYVGIVPFSDVVVTLNSGHAGATWATAPAGWVGVGAAPFTQIRRTQSAGSAVTWPVNPTHFGVFTPGVWTGRNPNWWPTTTQTFALTWTAQNVTVTLNSGNNNATWVTAPAGWTGVGTAPFTRITRTQTAGSAVTWPANPTRPGFVHTITGWAGNIDGQRNPNWWPSTATSHTFTALWTAPNVTVTLDSGHVGATWATAPVGWVGVGIAPFTQIRRTQTAGSAVTWPINPTRLGEFVINAWVGTEGRNANWWPSTALSHTFTAQWTASPVTVTLSSGLTGATWATAPAGWVGVGIAPYTQIRRTQSAGSAVTWPANPTRPEVVHTLTGWTGSLDANRNTNWWPTRSQTFTGVWGTPTVSVTLDSGAANATWATAPAGWTGVGTAPFTRITRTQMAGSAVTWPVNPTRPGEFTLYEWRGTEGRNLRWWPSTALSHTFTARWTANPVTVTLSSGLTGATWGTTAPDGWDGVGTAPYTQIRRTQSAGSAVTWPANPTRPEVVHTLTGWTGSLDASRNANWWPTASQTFTGVWETPSVSVMLDGNGSTWATAPAGWVGVGTAPYASIMRTQTAGSSVTWPINPIRAGYTLYAWAGNVDANRNVRWWPSTALSHTFTAQWAEDGTVTTVTLSGNGGSWATAPAGWDGVGAVPFTSITRQQVAGSGVTWPAPPTRTGYTLNAAWDPTRPTTWPLATATYAAQWTPSGPPFLWGDADDNGVVNNTDIFIIELFLAGLIAPPYINLLNANVTETGTVSNTDIFMIRLYLAGLFDPHAE